MTRRIFGTVLLLTLAGIGAAGQAQKAASPPAGRSIVLKGAEAKPLFHQCSRAAPQNVESNWNPTDTDIGPLEATLPAFLKTQKLPRRVHTTELVPYYHQCAGFVRNKHKMIYVNAFAPSIKTDHEHFPGPNKKKFDWRHQAITVCDGGPAFFGIEYDVTDRKFSNLSFNGPFQAN